MKRLLLSVITTTLLLNPLLMAKDSNSTYHVKIVEDNSNKKGFGSKLATNIVISIWKKTKNTVKEVFIGISTNIAANEITKKVEDYMKTKTTIDINKMNQHFNGQIRVALIENFSPTEATFGVMKPMTFDLNLRQNAYVYLISLSPNGSCLVFPNAVDGNNYLGVNNRRLPATDSYQILADRAEDETFYLVSSLEVQFFKEFKAKSIYKCTTKKRGIDKVAELSKKHTTQVAETLIRVVN